MATLFSWLITAWHLPQGLVKRESLLQQPSDAGKVENQRTAKDYRHNSRWIEELIPNHTSASRKVHWGLAGNHFQHVLWGAKSAGKCASSRLLFFKVTNTICLWSRCNSRLQYIVAKKKKELLNWARFMCATLHKVIKSLWRFCWETLIKEKKKWPVSSDLKWLSTFLRVAPLFFFSVVLLFLYARKKNDILNKAIFLIKSRKKKKKN